MLLIDPLSGKIIAANSAAIDYYKYPLDQLVGMSISEINHMSPELIAEEGQRALREEGNSYFFSHRLSSGELRDVEVHLTPIESGGRSLLFSIVHDITERKKVEQKLEVLAQTDLLTGLANRRHFMTLAEQELSRTLRYGGALSVLMMDIDHFKIVNDTYGHQAGDLVLQKLGELCLETLREVDLVGRIGGEEFAVILPQTDGEKTLEVAERLRQTVERAEVQLEFGLPLHITLSIGVTTLTGGGTNIDTLLGQADNALYEAKHAGRNRVCVYRSPLK
jgi:diguanylate cyclase (GGDEF)-like protein/PAS domain S-box-containing protein